MTHTPRKIILLAGDFLCLHLALLATLAVRYPGAELAERWSGHWLYFLPVFFIWLISLYVSGLYNLNFSVQGQLFYRALFPASLASTLLSVLYFYLNLESAIAPRTNLVIFLGLFLIIFYLWRHVFNLLARLVLPQERLALIGSPSSVSRLQQEITNYNGSGYLASLTITDPGQLSSAQAQIQAANIGTLVIAEDFASPADLNRLLSQSWRSNLAIFDYASFYEHLTGRVPLELIGPTWFLKNVQTRQKRYFDSLKQLVDYLAAGLLLILSLPLWLMIIISLKLLAPGRIFFTQERLGRDGRPFTIIKFRTLSEEADPQARRPIRGGRFLRATRLDELPQLLNILKGDMSFIGPRPEQREIAAQREQEIPFYRMRLLVKPGLTGWDQISGHYHSSSLSDTAAKLEYDLYYLKQRSPLLDAAIALKTIATIFSRSGR